MVSSDRDAPRSPITPAGLTPAAGRRTPTSTIAPRRRPRGHRRRRQAVRRAPDRSRHELARLDEALTMSSRETGLRFTLYVGDLRSRPGSRGAAAARRRHARRRVLIAVSPGQRVVEVVTGGRARRIPDRACALAVLSMRPSLSVGDLVGGIVNGLRQMSDQAGRPGAGRSPHWPPRPQLSISTRRRQPEPGGRRHRSSGRPDVPLGLGSGRGVRRARQSRWASPAGSAGVAGLAAQRADCRPGPRRPAGAAPAGRPGRPGTRRPPTTVGSTPAGNRPITTFCAISLVRRSQTPAITAKYRSTYGRAARAGRGARSRR